MKITYLDHLVLTVADIPTTTKFYEKVLGMKVVSFGAGRIAL
ncbi:VOC family protein, partial [Vibrio mimicus]